jgi:hypothetical protein
MANPKRPRDTNQLAKMIVDIATGDASDAPVSAKAKAGSKGGKLGGHVRMATLTTEQRRELSAKGVAARKKAPEQKSGA